MPLPEALAARLAKRGIIKIPSQPQSQNKETEVEVTNTLQEEIIAEDYDETPQPEEAALPQLPEKFDVYEGWYSCPNKWNVYHECSPFCQEQFRKIKEVDLDYSRKRVKMLLKYPLPIHWQEILDIGLHRYYYWNTETDLVSWLPPGHPKCHVSRSAAYLRKQMRHERELRLKEEKGEKKKGGSEEDEESSEDEGEKEKNRNKRKIPPKDTESDASSEESMDDALKTPTKEKKPRESEEKDKERVKDKERLKGKSRGRERKPKRKTEGADTIDPMDPAAYSDCPRGNWASGLPERNEAKTGVDTTATGQLFQMRPYPNPGAVLRANSAATVIRPMKPT